MVENHIYDESALKTLDWCEHIRSRPGMYVGRLSDGSDPDDGIYILFKEIVDNSIDEFMEGHGKEIHIQLRDGVLQIRDQGRGIPLGKLVEAVGVMNTGAKYDTKVFKRSVGMNGVGTKVVNALSSWFEVKSYRDGRMKRAYFKRGVLQEENEQESTEHSGVEISFKPDDDIKIFGNYTFNFNYILERINNYCYLNKGLKIYFNDELYVSKNGLLDLLQVKSQNTSTVYPIIYLNMGDLEIALTHTHSSGEDIYSFVNGQYTSQGGTHVQAFREVFVRVIRDFMKKEYESIVVRQGLLVAISVKITEPVFDGQTKTKLSSLYIEAGGKTLKTWMQDCLVENLDNFLHQNPQIAEALKAKIIENDRERSEFTRLKKQSSGVKKASIHNSKLRDCRYHYNDKTPTGSDKQKLIAKQQQSTIFITEGNSASGSIGKARDPETQAVFSLKGKPLNAFREKKQVYANEELILLRHALNVDNGLEHLRYKHIVLATDADVDGMHIRLLLITFFLQFFPEIIRNHHLFVLETPLFRVRNKKQTFYCYSEQEKQQAIKSLGTKPEITRFKGLGEISPDEFGPFITKDMRLQPITITNAINIQDLLAFYMGDNTPDRRAFIIENLRNESSEVKILA